MYINMYNIYLYEYVFTQLYKNIAKSNIKRNFFSIQNIATLEMQLHMRNAQCLVKLLLNAKCD